MLFVEKCNKLYLLLGCHGPYRDSNAGKVTEWSVTSIQQTSLFRIKKKKDNPYKGLSFLKSGNADSLLLSAQDHSFSVCAPYICKNDASASVAGMGMGDESKIFKMTVIPIYRDDGHLCSHILLVFVPLYTQEGCQCAFGESGNEGARLFSIKRYIG